MTIQVSLPVARKAGMLLASLWVAVCLIAATFVFRWALSEVSNTVVAVYPFLIVFCVAIIYVGHAFLDRAFSSLVEIKTTAETVDTVVFGNRVGLATAAVCTVAFFTVTHIPENRNANQPDTLTASSISTNFSEGTLLATASSQAAVSYRANQ